MRLADMDVQRPTLIGISVKLTPAEHAALRALVWNAGHTSFQSYFRSLAVQALREAQAQQGAGEGSDAVA